jgi:hypothetical protein
MQRRVGKGFVREIHKYQTLNWVSSHKGCDKRWQMRLKESVWCPSRLLEWTSIHECTIQDEWCVDRNYFSVGCSEHW